MENYYFNPDDLLFYPESIYGARAIAVVDEQTGEESEVPNERCLLPASAVLVDQATYETVLIARQDGKTIRAGDDGQPVIEDAPPISLAALAIAKRGEVDRASSAALRAVRSDYPDYEQLSWAQQEREAQEGSGPLIESIAQARGISLADLIERILAKVAAYSVAAGRVIGLRQALRDQIDAAEAAEDRDTLEAIQWPNHPQEVVDND